MSAEARIRPSQLYGGICSIRPQAFATASSVCVPNGTCGLVAMTSASHAEGRQFDPGQVYVLQYSRQTLPRPVD